ncbi:MAG: transposase [Verrucomicrobiales bacterium]
MSAEPLTPRCLNPGTGFETVCALIRKHFPNSKIVADRFHAIRIAQQHFMELVRSIAPQVKNNRVIPGCSSLPSRQDLPRPEAHPPTHLRSTLSSPT